MGRFSPGFRDFLREAPGQRELEVVDPEVVRGDWRVGKLRVRRFEVDHSIPGASAFAVKTSEAWIVYTGDLRLHGTCPQATRRFFKEAAKLKPLALITEGTCPEEEKPVTENDVLSNALEAVRRARGRLVVADFGPRHVARLLSFLKIARRTGRRLVITAKDAYLLGALGAAGVPGVPDVASEPRLAVYSRARTSPAKWERELLERLKGKVIDAQEVARNPGGYILCFSYYDFPEFMDINPQGGLYIYLNP